MSLRLTLLVIVSVKTQKYADILHLPQLCKGHNTV